MDGLREKGIGRSGEKGRKGSNSGSLGARGYIVCTSLDPQGYCGGQIRALSRLWYPKTSKSHPTSALPPGCSGDAPRSAVILVFPCRFLGFLNGLLSFWLLSCCYFLIVTWSLSIRPRPSNRSRVLALLIDELPRAPFISCPVPSTHCPSSRAPPLLQPHPAEPIDSTALALSSSPDRPGAPPPYRLPYFIGIQDRDTMMATVSKRQQARNERALHELIARVPGNNACADCSAGNPGTLKVPCVTSTPVC